MGKSTIQRSMEFLQGILENKTSDLITRERIAMIVGYLFGVGAAFKDLAWPNQALLILGAFALTLFIINQGARLLDRLRGNRRSPTEPDQEAVAEPLTWLEALADEDSQRMPICIDYVREGTKNLNVAEPYIDIEIGIRNCSVYPITLSREIEGKVQMQGSPLHLSPEVIVQGGSPLTIKHAGFLPAILRQRLFSEAARQISQDNTVQLSVGKVALWFTYQDRFGAIQKVRKSAGNIVSSS